MKKIGKLSLQFLIIMALTLGLLELVYRFQVVDFYADEFAFLNQNKSKGKEGLKVLVMGDSFSTGEGNYVGELKAELPEIGFFNAAVPGTGVIQASYMASRRFSQAMPDLFIYQIYLGNDLFDVRYPVNWNRLGFARNLYWSLSNRLRVVTWLNYKLAQFREPGEQGDAKLHKQTFAPELYNPRVKRYFQADPHSLENQLSLKEGWKSDGESYLAYLQDLLDLAGEKKVKVCLLVVPHCAQISSAYKSRMEAIGMAHQGEQSLGQAQFSWLEKIRSKAALQPDVQVLFPLEELQKADSCQGPVYFSNDPHLNPSGQKVLSRALQKWITKEMD